MFTYLFSTLRNKLKVPAARTLFNTQNLRRKSRNKLLVKSGIVIEGESAVTPPFYWEHGQITIGNSVFINAGCVFLDNAQISIGNDTLIGPHVTLATADHDVSPELRGNGVTQAPISIGHNVWLGAGVVVLPGALISVITALLPRIVLYVQMCRKMYCMRVRQLFLNAAFDIKLQQNIRCCSHCPLQRFSDRFDRLRNLLRSAWCRGAIHNPTACFSAVNECQNTLQYTPHHPL